MNWSVNATNNSLESYRTPIDVYRSIQTVLLAVELYLLISFTYFTNKNIKSKNQDSHSYMRISLFYLLIFVTMTGILRSGMQQQFHFLPHLISAKHCTTTITLFQVEYAAGIMGLYCFLWLRQHTLYAVPSMSNLVHVAVKRFSNFLLVLILLTGISSITALIYANNSSTPKFNQTTKTCSFTWERSEAINVIILVSFALVIFYQGSLLFLFVYILSRHRNQLLNFANDITGDGTQKLYRLMKNCSIAAAVAIATDLTIALLVVLIDGAYDGFYTLLIWEIDYVINLGCIVFCFSTWKELLNPWPWKKISVWWRLKFSKSAQ